MQFNKQHLSAEALLAKLETAGMAINRSTALPYMHMVGGYRLKGYWFHLRDSNGAFPAGTTFDDVIARYEFDRALRLITWQSLDQIEIAVRARIASYLSEAVNPHWFMEDCLFAQTPNPVYPNVKKEVDRAHKRAYVAHYRKQYTYPPVPPSWTTCECLSFGAWSKTFSLLADKTLKENIAKFFNVDTINVFGSWLHTLTVLRNTVAHHGRLWRMRVDVVPMEYRRKQIGASGDRSFYPLATIINYFLDNIGFLNDWPSRLDAVFHAYPSINKTDIGFGPTWNSAPGWVQSLNISQYTPPHPPASLSKNRKERRRAGSCVNP